MAMAATDVVTQAIAQNANHTWPCHRDMRRARAALVTRRDHRVRTARGRWQTTPLGPATSPLRLSQYVQDLGPDAVAISCSVLGAVPTTRRFIEASTSAGVPVVVGGAAFGRDEVRATAVGASEWAADARSAADAVAGLPAVVPPAPPLPDVPAQEQAAMEVDHRSWLIDCGVSGPSPRTRSWVRRRSRGDLLTRVLTAALVDYPLSIDLVRSQFKSN
ncbi:hypothetical protein ACVWWN_004631 [Mycobacterium sp. URHB0021]